MLMWRPAKSRSVDRENRKKYKVQRSSAVFCLIAMAVAVAFLF